jgi:hypothetical protein
VIGSREGGCGILARWVFSVTPMRSEEEAMGPGSWCGTRAGGPVRCGTKEGGVRRLTGHASGGGRWWSTTGETGGARWGV